MSLDKLNKNQLDDELLKKVSDDDTGESGSSTDAGTAGIAFKDFIGVGAGREDLLTPEEKKRLISVHQDLHELRVKKEKAVREERKALKEGKITLTDFRQRVGNIISQYKANPLLANKAQFSGIDRQVNPLSTENVANTNEGNRDELEHQYRLRNAPTNAPRFNPKPQYNR